MTRVKSFEKKQSGVQIPLWLLTIGLWQNDLIYQPLFFISLWRMRNLSQGVILRIANNMCSNLVYSIFTIFTQYVSQFIRDPFLDYVTITQYTVKSNDQKSVVEVLIHKCNDPLFSNPMKMAGLNHRKTCISYISCAEDIADQETNIEEKVQSETSVFTQLVFTGKQSCIKGSQFMSLMDQM